MQSNAGDRPAKQDAGLALAQLVLEHFGKKREEPLSDSVLVSMVLLARRVAASDENDFQDKTDDFAHLSVMFDPDMYNNNRSEFERILRSQNGFEDYCVVIDENRMVYISAWDDSRFSIFIYLNNAMIDSYHMKRRNLDAIVARVLKSMARKLES